MQWLDSVSLKWSPKACHLDILGMAFRFLPSFSLSQPEKEHTRLSDLGAFFPSPASPVIYNSFFLVNRDHSHDHAHYPGWTPQLVGGIWLLTREPSSQRVWLPTCIFLPFSITSGK